MMATIGLRLMGVLLLVAALHDITPSHARRSENQADNPTPTVARINQSSHGVTITVDSKLVGHTATNNLLYLLNQVRDKYGPDSPVIVLVDSRVSFSEVWNFEGVAGKAQLNNLRVYVSNRESDQMTEVKWGPTIPFSTNPK